MIASEPVSVITDDCLLPVFTEITRSLQQVEQSLAQAEANSKTQAGTNASTNASTNPSTCAGTNPNATANAYAEDAGHATLMTSMVVMLGQVEAAFTVADADSLAAVTALSQRLMVRLSEDPSLFHAGLVPVLEQALSTLLDATDRLRLHQPVSVSWLLPCWTALATWDRAGHAHPSALLSLRADYTKLSIVEVAAEAALQSDPRGEFERALLRFLRSESADEVAQAAQRMALVMAAIASREQPAEQSAGWQVLHAATGLIASGGIKEATLSKKILAATGRVIRHIGPTGSLPVPAALVREALFAIATASVHTTESTAVVQAFALASQLPSQLPSGDAAGPTAAQLLAAVDPLAIKAVSDETRALIVSLDTPGRSDLPAPAELDPLIDACKQLPECGRIANALSHLQAKLSSNDVHPGQALAVAACLLSLQQCVARLNGVAGTALMARGIAAALDTIGEQEGLPSWRTLHRMGIALQMPSVLTALTQVLTESLIVVERQTERLIDEVNTPSEHQATLLLIDRRLSEMHAALCMVGQSTLLAHLEKVRDQLRMIFSDAGNEQRLHALDRFARQFVHLSHLIALMQRTHPVDVSDSAEHHESALASEPDASESDEENSLSELASDNTLALRAIFIEEASARIHQLKTLLDVSNTKDTAMFELAANATHALAGCSATVGLSDMRQLAMAMEAVLSALHMNGGGRKAAALVLLRDALQALEQMLADWSLGIMPEIQPALFERLLALSLEMPDTSALSVMSELPELFELPEVVDASDKSDKSDRPDKSDKSDTQVCASAREAQLSVTFNARVEEAASEHNKRQEPANIQPLNPALAEPAKPVTDAVHDELHEIFTEEASDLMPQLDQLLRSWIAEPSDREAPAQMLRILHTLKGSARMAGEVTLGDELHRMEQTVDELMRQISPDAAALRVLEATLDQCLQPFVPVTSLALPVSDHATGSTLKPAIDTTATGPVDDKLSVESLSPSVTQFTSPESREKPAVSLQLRVRADFLDRITSSGAELLVGSSRLASELQLQRQSVSDLSDNLGRLRSQLRELEIHAESNIASGVAHKTAAGFDPLEFDRYTRLHELTRMMSESIADIGSLQRTLSRQLDNAALTVTAQGRHARGLQSDLRRVRTVPFASLSGRLQHLLRQVARDKGCDVVLSIDGGKVEVDRSVLDRITGPLEHLLRNAVAHGIESPGERLSKGKSAVGHISMSLSQQGNGLLMQIRDDGRGLDHQRIRQRAITLGLLRPDAHVDETVLSELIFEPGFSTASEITELSGRGIGMDAVRSVVVALGGQIKVTSAPGEGSCFILSLPLTLATMQVVMVTAGSRDLAIPATLVQQMLQLSPSELAQARNDAGLAWQGRHMPLHRLAGLLGEPVTSGDIAHRTPVAVIRQLDQMLAIELDAVAGHREVVVKNLGPQLAQVPGLAGATVQGNGSITLIINPLPLPEFVATHATHPSPRLSSENRVKQAPAILVVDDSLTVRRASQRLLERHGYTVMLARDGLDALAQLRLHSPAAVLLDIEMPRMDGFELLTALRDDPRWRDLPVAMITSRTAERHREHAMKLGATDYLGKPFVEEELLALLTQWLASPATEDKLDFA